MSFVHLHNHSCYSALDGFSKIEAIVQRVKEIEQPAIALTDHGNLNGTFKFYNACKKEGIKPILGIEAYTVKSYEDRTHPYHVTLLAKNNIGWNNLLKLFLISSQNEYYRPRMSFDDLHKHREGIICLSGCYGGILQRPIRENDTSLAEEHLSYFKDCFDDFYIEIMDQGLTGQIEINNTLRELAQKYSIPTVVTNDTHYTIKDHSTFQDYLVCDRTGATLTQERTIKLETNEFYIKTREEMLGTEEEKNNTLRIAEMCNVELNFSGFLLPKIDNQKEIFIKELTEGIEKYGLKENKQYMDRLREEFQIIDRANLMGYFLIVQDYIKYAQSQGILVGPGRGSVGGSLVAYLLDIHTVDPIKHKLLFSRFYNAGRSNSLPDIDVDFPENQIAQVREYVRQKYGQEKVSQIGTYTYLHKKSALKLVCRVLGVDFKTANEYSKIIEDEKQTAKLCKQSPTFCEIAKKSAEFEGLSTHSSIHAAGIVISPIDLNTIVPVRLNKDNGLYVSNWDMKDIEKIGLIKFDFLSLNTLDVISDTLRNAGIKIEDIPLDNKETFSTISTTSNVGIFQLSSDGISKVANEVVVNSIDDIAAVVALYRPGPIYSGLHTSYINRKHGREPIVYDHPLLEESLKDTYGIFVFQEQIIKAVMLLANFSETEADNLRKAIGKKIPELMQAQKDRFIKGCATNKINSNDANYIWGKIELFASYSFCLAHSVSYSYITYYTAYLKTHFPLVFMAALLNNNYGSKEKLSIYLRECDRMGIVVAPPSVTNGAYEFKAGDWYSSKDGNTIYFGIKGIKGIGEETAKKIFEKKYSNFSDFCVKFKPSSGVLIALAEAGAFDEFGINRNSIIQYSSQISEIIKSRKKHKNERSRSLFKTETAFDIPIIEDLSEEELASNEYERLNTYLVHNPLKNKELDTPEKLEGEIYIEGYVIGLKEHITKKKQTMAFLTLATNLGEIEALLFPSLYDEKKDLIRKNVYVGIDGKYEDKLLIRKIWRI